MRWRLWWWQKVRRADIAPDLRERFEFYGERLVALAIESHDPDKIGAELADLGQHKRMEIIGGCKNVVIGQLIQPHFE